MWPCPSGWVPGFGRISFSLEVGGGARHGFPRKTPHSPGVENIPEGLTGMQGGMGTSRNVLECRKWGWADVPSLSLSCFPLDGAIGPGMPGILPPPPPPPLLKATCLPSQQFFGIIVAMWSPCHPFSKGMWVSSGAGEEKSSPGLWWMIQGEIPEAAEPQEGSG